MRFFYKPEDGWAGDFIPFYWQGEFHLFYLKDYRDKTAHGEGTPWFHLGTRDHVHFVEYGEALPRGSADEQDLYVFTGCALEHEGTFHIFYTGHNPHFRAAGKPEQAVMHAVSTDLLHWEKDLANPILFADDQHFEPHDWRDPFVFWNEEAQEWWMLLAARQKHGPSNRRGITALVSSKDLTTWQVRDPFWAPDLYFTHECPDLFRMGEWWYLIYSTFSERNITHYRMSKSLSAPWLAPSNDAFDGRAFYAAKTASDGKRRFVYAWNPTRTDESDTKSWNWGGSLVVHEVLQQPDGSLTVQMPAEIAQQFTKEVYASFVPQRARWEQQANAVSAQVADSFAYARLAPVPPVSLLETTITFTENTRGVGVIVREDDDLNRGYQIRLEPGRNRVVFDRFPRPGDEPPIIERPVELHAGEPVQVQVIIEDSIIMAYIDGVALSTRGYEHRGGYYGLFVSEGTAEFTGTRIRETP